MTAHPFDRDEALHSLSEGSFDLLVVGGGITGAGVALDAASRGLRTALVERRDFASGTSSRSSKLVHGGIRYLQQREVGLVYESLAERQRLLDNAPHLVRPLQFLVPLFGRHGAVDSAVARTYSGALWTYDLTGGLRIGRRHKRIGAEEVLRLLPTLRTDRLVAGFIYHDARTDDARLTLAVLRTAVDHGAVAANYAAVTELLRGREGRLAGAVVRADDPVRATARELEVRARSVVNATGVWADEVRALDEGSSPRSLRPAKGIHVTVERSKLPCDVATVLPVPGDRRSVFVVPWDDDVYIGTTDTDYSGPLDEPSCTPEDVGYLLRAVNAAVSRPLSPDDVESAWAGLRPLAAGDADPASRTADLSRRHRVEVSPSGMVSVTGGKLTTYRKMGADTVDAVVRTIGTGRRRSQTKKLPLHGAAGTTGLRSPGAAERLGVDPATLAHLVSRHGGEALEVLAIARAGDGLGEPLVPGMRYLKAEALHAVRHEMAVTLEDVLSRRTRALLRRRDPALQAAPEVAQLLAPELGWVAEDAESQISSLYATLAAGRA
jgi:glycerol-3-phosphate dehydrogenase